jgi:hypothetical protein
MAFPARLMAMHQQDMEREQSEVDGAKQDVETTRDARVAAEGRAERAEEAATGADSHTDAAAVAGEELTAAHAELDQAGAAAQEARERAQRER